MLGCCLCLIAIAALPACERSEKRPTRAPGPMRVVVTIPPLEGLIRPLLPADATVKVLIPPGRSEHGYEPTLSDTAALAEADVVVLVGMGLEGAVDTYLRRRPQPFRHEARLGVILGLEDAHGGHGHDDHAHDPHAHDDHDHDHDHAGHDHDHDHAHAIDPHVWLDPIMMKQALPEIARLIEVSMSEAGIMEGAGVSEKLATLEARIDEVHARYTSELAPLTNRSIVTHHAAFGRLAERYNLRVAEVIRPIEGAEPTPARLAAALGAIERENVPAIFIEPQFDRRGAELLAQRAGVKLGQLDPLGSGDWFAMMEANLQELVDKLGG